MMPSTQSAHDQVTFLGTLQRCYPRSEFQAAPKYALLVALAVLGGRAS